MGLLDYIYRYYDPRFQEATDAYMTRNPYQLMGAGGGMGPILNSPLVRPNPMMPQQMPQMRQRGTPAPAPFSPLTFTPPNSPAITGYANDNTPSDADIREAQSKEMLPQGVPDLVNQSNPAKTGGGILDKFFGDPKNLGLLAFGSSLLESSGPSPTPISLGQAIGRAGTSGIKGYTTAKTAQTTSLLNAIKLQREMKNQEMMEKMTGVMLPGSSVPGGASVPGAGTPRSGVPAGYVLKMTPTGPQLEFDPAKASEDARKERGIKLDEAKAAFEFGYSPAGSGGVNAAGSTGKPDGLTPKGRSDVLAEASKQRLQDSEKTAQQWQNKLGVYDEIERLLTSPEGTQGAGLTDRAAMLAHQYGWQDQKTRNTQRVRELGAQLTLAMGSLGNQVSNADRETYEKAQGAFESAKDPQDAIQALGVMRSVASSYLQNANTMRDSIEGGRSYRFGGNTSPVKRGASGGFRVLGRE